MHDIYGSWEIQCPYNALLYLLSYFYLNILVNEIEKYFYPSFFGHLWNCYCYFKIYAFGLHCFKIKVLTTFKMSSDCYIKISRFAKRKVFWKSQVPFKNLCPLWSFQNETSKKKKRFHVLRQIPTQTLQENVMKRATVHFFLSIWWTTFFKHLFSLICFNGMNRT